MKAQDILRADVVAVSADTPLPEIADLLVQHRACSVPVLDEEGCVIGIVSEDDFLHRIETGTERRLDRLAAFFTSHAVQQQAYVRSRALKACDIMRQDLPLITPDTALSEIVETLENHNLNSAAVTKDGRLVGMISRNDMVRAYASVAHPCAPTAEDDRSIRDALLAELDSYSWGGRFKNAIFVTDGVVHLWGHVASPTELAALRIAAERIPGVRHVHDHTVSIKPVTIPEEHQVRIQT